jgi:hypothetical protein
MYEPPGLVMSFVGGPVSRTDRLLYTGVFRAQVGSRPAPRILTDGYSQMRIAQLLRGGGEVPGQSAEQSSPNGPGQPVPQPMTPVLSDTRRNSAEAVTWPVRVAASWSWRLLLVAAGVYVLVRVSASVGIVIFAVIIALFLTAVLLPLVRQFRRLIPGPNSLPPLLALLTGVTVLGAIGYLVGWQISSHTTVLADDVSQQITQAEQWLRTQCHEVKGRGQLSRMAGSAC